MVDNAPATVLGHSAVASPQVVVIRERAANTYTTFVLGILAVLLAIMATITLSIGGSLWCHYSSQYPDYSMECYDKEHSYMVAGYTLISASVCLLIAAIIQYYRMRKAARLNQFNPHRQPAIISPGYPGQPVIALNTMSAQYPPLYSPPPVLASYPASPAANQHPQNVGVTGNTNATHM